MLQIPPTHPIGVRSDSLGHYRFVKDTDVTKFMRCACEVAYPNPNHYMRTHIGQLVPHFNRVTAAVALQQGGASNDKIAFKLRSHPTSVPTYLRNCFQALGTTLVNMVQGVLRVAFSSLLQ